MRGSREQCTHSLWFGGKLSVIEAVSGSPPHPTPRTTAARINDRQEEFRPIHQGLV